MEYCFIRMARKWLLKGLSGLYLSWVLISIGFGPALASAEPVSNQSSFNVEEARQRVVNLLAKDWHAENIGSCPLTDVLLDDLVSGQGQNHLYLAVQTKEFEANVSEWAEMGDLLSEKIPVGSFVTLAFKEGEHQVASLTVKRTGNDAWTVRTDTPLGQAMEGTVLAFSELYGLNSQTVLINFAASAMLGACGVALTSEVVAMAIAGTLLTPVGILAVVLLGFGTYLFLQNTTDLWNLSRTGNYREWGYRSAFFVGQSAAAMAGGGMLLRSGYVPQTSRIVLRQPAFEPPPQTEPVLRPANPEVPPPAPRVLQPARPETWGTTQAEDGIAVATRTQIATSPEAQAAVAAFLDDFYATQPTTAPIMEPAPMTSPPLALGSQTLAPQMILDQTIPSEMQTITAGKAVSLEEATEEVRQRLYRAYLAETSQGPKLTYEEWKDGISDPRERPKRLQAFAEDTERFSREQLLETYPAIVEFVDDAWSLLEPIYKTSSFWLPGNPFKKFRQMHSGPITTDAALKALETDIEAYFVRKYSRLQARRFSIRNHLRAALVQVVSSETIARFSPFTVQIQVFDDHDYIKDPAQRELLTKQYPWLLDNEIDRSFYPELTTIRASDPEYQVWREFQAEYIAAGGESSVAGYSGFDPLEDDKIATFYARVGSSFPDFVIIHEIGHIFQNELLMQLVPEILSLKKGDDIRKLMNLFVELEVQLEMASPWPSTDPTRELYSRFDHICNLVTVQLNKLRALRELITQVHEILSSCEWLPRDKIPLLEEAFNVRALDLIPAFEAIRESMVGLYQRNNPETWNFHLEVRDKRAVEAEIKLLSRAQGGRTNQQPQQGLSLFDGAVQRTTAETPAQKVKNVGRNEPCPCGSGKKYKKCCGKK